MPFGIKHIKKRTIGNHVVKKTFENQTSPLFRNKNYGFQVSEIVILKLCIVFGQEMAPTGQRPLLNDS